MLCMKLGGVIDDTTYVTQRFATGTWTPTSGFSPLGRLDHSSDPLDRTIDLVHDRGSRLTRPIVGSYPISNIWPLGDQHLLASTQRFLHYSRDGGQTWNIVHELPASSGPMGVLPTSLEVSEDGMYVAEYPLGDEPARILRSETGERWKPIVITPQVRHFHNIKRDPYTGRLWATAGDSSEECGIGYIEDGHFRPVGSGSQRWRAVDLAFTPSCVIWGMDCSYADQVDLLRLDREDFSSANPSPRQIGTIDGSVFYTQTVSFEGATWILATTAAEVGGDRSAPSHTEHGPSTNMVRLIGSSSETGFEEWCSLAEFRRRRSLGDFLDALPNASAYAYLDIHPDDGLLVNPYNTMHYDGDILAIPLSTVAESLELDTGPVDPTQFMGTNVPALNPSRA